MIECYFFGHETPPVSESQAWELMTAGEIARAKQFLHPKPRREFLLTRGALKQILARKLGRSPAALEFLQNASGKPFLEDCDLHFNVSHSHGISLIGLRQGGTLGVDVEPLKDLTSRESLARRWFHPAEVTQLEALGWDIQTFFSIWTAKEAVVKALGTGLGFGMDEVWIHLNPKGHLVLKQLGKTREIPAEWNLDSRKLHEKQVASVAYQGRPAVIVWQELGNPLESLK